MHQESIASGFLGIAAAFSLIIGKSLAVSASVTPPWIEQIIGPFGAVIALTIAIVWFARRMDKSEEREVQRQKQREDLLKELVTNNVRLAVALERNSEILDKVEKRYNESQ